MKHLFVTAFVVLTVGQVFASDLIEDTISARKVGSNLRIAFEGEQAKKTFDFLKVRAVTVNLDGATRQEKRTKGILCYYLQSEENYEGHECVLELEKLGNMKSVK